MTDDDKLEPSRRALLTLLATLAGADTASAQDASQVQPDSYRVVLENDRVRVLDFRSRPGMGVCGVGMHSHPAHLGVALSDGKVRVTRPDGTTFVANTPLGTVFWSEAETHQTENLTGWNMRGLVIELKDRKS